MPGQVLADVDLSCEIAEAVAFVASDAASFCTGSTIAVDGGLTS